MRRMEDEAVDSIVTDPPYGLSFMGKHWDHGVPSAEVWVECLRVLKPGGHLLAFAGTRTQHRMATAIEDAGFEIRDMIAWVYGSGFPKSLDVSKAIDKAAGAEREVVGSKLGQPGYSLSKDKGRNIYNADGRSSEVECAITAPSTEAAKQWQGWGTALKPALEPITVARKPLIGTVAANVLAHGTGAINVDGCRVGINPKVDDPRLGGKGDWSSDKMAKNIYEGGYSGKRVGSSILGRWPANLIHDGSEEVVERFPKQAGASAPVRGTEPSTPAPNGIYGVYDRHVGQFYGDSGSASRFFYCAKASRSERGESNSHPTVKPIALMEYLVRLVTPPGGLVYDPFAGSGSTAIACVKGGFQFVGSELQQEYKEIAERRIAHWQGAPTLFTQAVSL
jgi:site-specific DNA-methyltransferase (adenine-specific)